MAQRIIEGTFAWICVATLGMCLWRVASSEACLTAFKEFSEDWTDEKSQKKVLLYVTSIGSFIFGLGFCAIAGTFYLWNPKNPTVWQCYPMVTSVSWWMLATGLVHLFFVARIRQTFSQSAFTLSAIKSRALTIAIIITNTGEALYIACLTIHFAIVRYDKEEMEVSGVYGCISHSYHLREYSSFFPTVSLYTLAGFTLAIIEIRLYIRRLFFVIRKARDSEESRTQTNTETPGQSSDTTNTNTAGSSEMNSDIIVDQMLNKQSNHMPSEKNSLKRVRSSSLTPGMIRKSSENAKPFIELANRTTTLAIIAIISSLLGMILSLRFSRSFITLDVLINGLCVYFCFDVSRPCINPCCYLCLTCVDRYCLPGFFVCCDLDCCACSRCDCDHQNSSISNTTNNNNNTEKVVQCQHNNAGDEPPTNQLFPEV